jgi:hypothetical protein
MLPRAKMVKSKERKELKRPLYYIRTGYAAEAVSRQQIWIIDSDNYETIAVSDTGSYIDSEEEACFPSLERMLNAKHDKERHPILRSKNLLISPIFEQLERRLCLDPYQQIDAERKTSTEQRR